MIDGKQGLWKLSYMSEQTRMRASLSESQDTERQQGYKPWSIPSVLSERHPPTNMSCTRHGRFESTPEPSPKCLGLLQGRRLFFVFSEASKGYRLQLTEWFNWGERKTASDRISPSSWRERAPWRKSHAEQMQACDAYAGVSWKWGSSGWLQPIGLR